MIRCHNFHLLHSSIFPDKCSLPVLCPVLFLIFFSDSLYRSYTCSLFHYSLEEVNSSWTNCLQFIEEKTRAGSRWARILFGSGRCSLQQSGGWEKGRGQKEGRLKGRRKERRERKRGVYYKTLIEIHMCAWHGGANMPAITATWEIEAGRCQVQG